MEEILELQRKLAAVQLVDTNLKLNDRNVIDIVIKLRDSGQLDVIFTTNGKEFLTPSQLRLELMDELQAAGGRLLLNDVQPLLSVDLTYVEKAAQDLADGDPEVYLVGGSELFTVWHLDRLAKEVNESLQEQGMTKLAWLAARFNMPAQFVLQFITERLAGEDQPSGAPPARAPDCRIHARLSAGVLSTDAYEARQMVYIRGACSGATRPVSVARLVQEYNLDDKAADGIVRKLIKSGELLGTLRGREYVPDIFTQMQRARVRQFFEANHYLEYSMAQKLQVSKVESLVHSMFPDAVALEHAVVDPPRLLPPLEAQLEAALQARGWAEATQHLPAALAEEDAARLLSMCRSCGGGGGGGGTIVQMAELYGASSGFLEDCLSGFSGLAQTKAQQLAAERKGCSARSIALRDHAEGELTAARAPRKAKAAYADSDDGSSDDGRGAHRKARKGRKGSVQGQGGGKKGKGRGSKAGESKGRAQAEDLIDGKQLQAHLLAWHPKLEEHQELLEALTDHLLRPVQETYAREAQDALSSVHHGDAAARRKAESAFQEEFERLYQEMRALAQGVRAFVDGAPPGCEEGAEEMEAHVLETKGVQLAALVTAHQCSLAGVEYEAAPQTLPPTSEGQAPSAPPEAAGVESIVKHQQCMLVQVGDDLPNGLSEALVKLWALVAPVQPTWNGQGTPPGGQALGEFQHHLDTEVIPLCNMLPPRSDKKQLRPFLHALRQSYVTALEMATGGASVASLALALLFCRAKGVVPPLSPGEGTVDQLLLRLRGMPDMEPALHIISGFWEAWQAHQCSTSADLGGGATASRIDMAQQMTDRLEAVRSYALQKPPFSQV